MKTAKTSEKEDEKLRQSKNKQQQYFTNDEQPKIQLKHTENEQEQEHGIHTNDEFTLSESVTFQS